MPASLNFCHQIDTRYDQTGMTESKHRLYMHEVAFTQVSPTGLRYTSKEGGTQKLFRHQRNVMIEIFLKKRVVRLNAENTQQSGT